VTRSSSHNDPEIKGALDCLVRVVIKENTNKRSEKSKSTEPIPARSTPVNQPKEPVSGKETLSKESIKLPNQNIETRSDTSSSK